MESEASEKEQIARYEQINVPPIHKQWNSEMGWDLEIIKTPDQLHSFGIKQKSCFRVQNKKRKHVADRVKLKIGDIFSEIMWVASEEKVTPSASEWHVTTPDDFCSQEIVGSNLGTKALEKCSLSGMKQVRLTIFRPVYSDGRPFFTGPHPQEKCTAAKETKRDRMLQRREQQRLFHAQKRRKTAKQQSDESQVTPACDSHLGAEMARANKPKKKKSTPLWCPKKMSKGKKQRERNLWRLKSAEKKQQTKFENKRGKKNSPPSPSWRSMSEQLNSSTASKCGSQSINESEEQSLPSFTKFQERRKECKRKRDEVEKEQTAFDLSWDMEIDDDRSKRYRKGKKVESVIGKKSVKPGLNFCVSRSEISPRVKLPRKRSATQSLLSKRKKKFPITEINLQDPSGVREKSELLFPEMDLSNETGILSQQQSDLADEAEISDRVGGTESLHSKSDPVIQKTRHLSLNGKGRLNSSVPWKLFLKNPEYYKKQMKKSLEKAKYTLNRTPEKIRKRASYLTHASSERRRKMSAYMQSSAERRRKEMAYGSAERRRKQAAYKANPIPKRILNAQSYMRDKDKRLAHAKKHRDEKKLEFEVNMAEFENRMEFCKKQPARVSVHVKKIQRMSHFKHFMTKRSKEAALNRKRTWMAQVCHRMVCEELQIPEHEVVPSDKKIQASYRSAILKAEITVAHALAVQRLGQKAFGELLQLILNKYMSAEEKLQELQENDISDPETVEETLVRCYGIKQYHNRSGKPKDSPDDDDDDRRHKPQQKSYDNQKFGQNDESSFLDSHGNRVIKTSGVFTKVVNIQDESSDAKSLHFHESMLLDDSFNPARASTPAPQLPVKRKLLPGDSDLSKSSHKKIHLDESFITTDAADFPEESGEGNKSLDGLAELNSKAERWNLFAERLSDAACSEDNKAKSRTEDETEEENQNLKAERGHLIAEGLSDAANSKQNQTKSRVEDDNEEEEKQFPCNENCKLPEYWASALHDALQKLGGGSQKFSLFELQNKLLEFEECEYCEDYVDQYPYCPQGEKCRDTIKLLHSVQLHYVGIRTLLRQIYRARAINHWLLEMVLTFEFRSQEELEHFVKNGIPGEKGDAVKKTMEDKESDDERVKRVTEQSTAFNKLREKFNIEKYKFPTSICDVCNVWKLKTTEVPLEKLPNYHHKKYDTILQLANDLEKEEKVVLKKGVKVCNVCKPCLNEMKQKPALPPSLSSRNKMAVDDPPELKDLNLNLYESTLIRLAKTFMTVVRLKPYAASNAPPSDLIKSLKGLAVHYPLPLAKTLKHIEETAKEFPSADNLTILVDSLPTSQQKVWRQAVNMGKVYTALHWLKDNNHLYKDIIIRDADDLESFLCEAEHPVQLTTSAEEAAAAAKLSDNQQDAMLRHMDEEDMETYHYSVQNIDAHMPNLKDSELYQQKRVLPDHLSDHMKGLEYYCFPDVFPMAKNGMHEERVKPVRSDVYLRSRLLNRNPKFRLNAQYLFFEQSRKIQRQISSGVYTMFNTKKFGNHSPMEMIDKITNGSPEIEGRLNTLLQSIPGTAAWWNKQRQDLFAQISMYGPPTFFATFSVAEYNWPDMRDYMNLKNGHLPNVERIRIGNLIANDTVSATEQFKRRFDAFWKEVIMGGKSSGGIGPLGEVEHYFWRIEFQARGAPHVHCLLWIKGAPVLKQDKSNAEEVKSFIDKYITCYLPPEEDIQNGELRTKVLNYQMHKCTKSCKRVKHVKGKFLTFCRYGFPRKQSNHTEISTAEKSVKSRAQGKGEKCYSLHRQNSERQVNDYNPALLLAWDANMDIQYVAEDTYVVVNYITKYVTKTETNSTAELWKEICEKQGKSSYAKAYEFGVKAMKKREIGLYEAAFSLLGYSLTGKKSGDSIFFVNSLPAEERMRKLKPLQQLKKLPADSPADDFFFKNFVTDRYPNRPEDPHFEKMCLFDLAANYQFELKSKAQRKNEKKPVDEDDLEQQEEINRPIEDVEEDNDDGESEDKEDRGQKKEVALKDGSGYFCKRRKPRIVRTNYYSMKTTEGQENFFHSLLILFTPWRNEKELLGDYNSFAEAYRASEVEIKKRAGKWLLGQEKLKQAEKLIEDWEEQCQEEANKQTGNAVEEETDESTAQDVAQVLPNVASVKTNDLLTKISKLNKDQKDIFQKIITSVEHQETHNHKSCGCPENKSLPIRRVVSGVAGTGKSFLIQTLVDKLNHDYSADGKASVAVMAPTGLAAFNVNGMTIHRFFSPNFPVQKTGEIVLKTDLSSTDRNKLKEVLKNVKLLIIDEFSMVSNAMLTQIHLLLNAVTAVAEDDNDLAGKEIEEITFGGMNILLFGDLMQLPPVKSEFCFKPFSATQRKAMKQGIHIYCNLWEQFCYSELEINMRQQDDLPYAKLLNRIRMGNYSEEDDKLLKRQLISGEYCGNLKDKASFFCEKILKKDPRAMCLLSKNAPCHEFNEIMVKEILMLDTIEIPAEDEGFRFHKAEAKKKSLKKSKKHSKNLKTSETAGLEENLLIGKDARVMLRRNMPEIDGLFNGAVGTVVEIKKDHRQNVKKIKVDFGTPGPGVVDIEKISADFELGGCIVSRKQFPLMLAYAITIHKSQGLTLDSVFLELDESVFSDAQAYVALSRVRKLENVYLGALDGRCIHCSHEAAEEYIRLRDSAGLDTKSMFYNQRPDKFKKPFKKTGPRLDDKRKGMASEEAAACRFEMPGPSASTKAEFLRFENVGLDCYGNSIIQALLEVDDKTMKNSLHPAGGNLLSGLLASLYDMQCRLRNGKSEICLTDVSDICMEVLEGTSNEFREMQDAAEFWLKLYEKLPVASQQLFQFEQAEKKKCSLCLHSFTTVQSHVECILRLPVSDQRIQLQDLLSKFYAGDDDADARCPQCQQCGHLSWMTEVDLRTTKYLFVRLEVGFGANRMQNREITGFTNQKMTIDTEAGRLQYQAIAAILMNTRIKHYTCLRKSPSSKKWTLLDDAKIPQQQKFATNLKNVYVLLLEQKRQN